MVETSATALSFDESVTAAIHFCFIWKQTAILKIYKEHSPRTRHEVRKVRKCEKAPKSKCKYNTSEATRAFKKHLSVEGPLMYIYYTPPCVHNSIKP